MNQALFQLSYLGMAPRRSLVRPRLVLTPGVEPGPAAYQTAMPTAYTRPGRKVEVPTPYGLSTAHGYSRPVAAPAAHLPRAESGESGIRTHEGRCPTCFRGRRHRPLGDLHDGEGRRM